MRLRRGRHRRRLPARRTACRRARRCTTTRSRAPRGRSRFALELRARSRRARWTSSSRSSRTAAAPAAPRASPTAPARWVEDRTTQSRCRGGTGDALAATSRIELPESARRRPRARGAARLHPGQPRRRRPSSPARARTSAPGSATARSPARRCCGSATPRSCATSSTGSRRTSTPNGKVPCCVDQRGADPVPEHDASGEFIYLVAEYYRYTGDRALAERLWPRCAARRVPRHAAAAAAHAGVARRRRSERVLRPAAALDQPRGVLGQADALVLGRLLRAARLRATPSFLAEELGQLPEGDAHAPPSATSSRATSRPRSGRACACTGSTTSRAAPTWATSTPPRPPSRSPRAGASDILPPAALERTFEQYWEFFRDRRDGQPWEAFTPYEMRNVGAFVRLGWRDRAAEALDFFLAYRSRPGWRQWAEVVCTSEPCRASSATCRTPGWARTSCARSSTCSPTSASRPGAGAAARRAARRGCRATACACAICGRPTGRSPTRCASGRRHRA